MNRKLSPKSVRQAVDDGVYMAVYRAVDETVHQAVGDAVYGAVEDAVHMAVNDAADDAVWDVVRKQPHPPSPHPNLDRLIAEIRRTRGGET